jgi:RNA polymerase sporulation-specific sigma factor
MFMNKVEICGVDTSKLPVLSSKELHALLVKVKEGDPEAREKFIYCNLRLVLSVIQRFNNRGEHVDDLFQVGCIGLLKSIENFDLSHDVKFSTYAVPMIVGEIRRYLRDYNAIRVSRSLRDTAYKALKARTRLMTENSREPPLADIAKALEMKEEDVAFALDAIQDPISLFEPVYHDGSDAIFVMDQVADPSSTADEWMDSIALDEGINRLSEREARILKMRFFDGRTQIEVADEIGISQAQVSRLEKSALKHMRKYV